MSEHTDLLFRGDIANLDPTVAHLIEREHERQARKLIMIPSESYAHRPCGRRSAQSCRIFTLKAIRRCAPRANLRRSFRMTNTNWRTIAATATAAFTRVSNSQTLSKRWLDDV